MSETITVRIRESARAVFGRRQLDPVERQLRDLARQGSGMAGVAHGFSLFLIILFSLGSFVSLGGDAFRHVLTAAQAGHLDIPSSISLGVTALFVPAMDVAMFYAATKVRLLAMRRAQRSEFIVHVIVLLGVSVLESATYIYMSWKYEQPQDSLAWALIIGRGVAAPLLANYLALARPMAVAARDIMAQAELSVGAGVLRDVVTMASDNSASLAEKMELYRASAVMLPADGTRLDNMINVLGQRTAGNVPELPPPSQPPTPPRLPRGWDDEVEDDPEEEDRYATQTITRGNGHLNGNGHSLYKVRTPAPTAAETPEQGARARKSTVLPASTLQQIRKRTRMTRYTAQGYAALDEDQTLTKNDLRKIIGCRMKDASEIHDNYFHDLRQRRWLTEDAEAGQLAAETAGV